MQIRIGMIKKLHPKKLARRHVSQCSGSKCKWKLASEKLACCRLFTFIGCRIWKSSEIAFIIHQCFIPRYVKKLMDFIRRWKRSDKLHHFSELLELWLLLLQIGPTSMTMDVARVRMSLSAATPYSQPRWENWSLSVQLSLFWPPGLHWIIYWKCLKSWQWHYLVIGVIGAITSLPFSQSKHLFKKGGPGNVSVL